MSTNGFCFETEWPSAAVRLKACLRRRKIPDSLIDDLVQDTAIRLYQNWGRVDPERGAWPLAVTVAMNIMRDQMRVEARRRDAVLPPLPVQEDPEAVALARVELERVRAAMVQLPDAQRTALLAEIGESQNGEKSSAAIKMLRMRARKRLRAMTREASGLLGTLELLLQRLLGRPDWATGAACAPVAACVLTFGVFAPSHLTGELEMLSRSPEAVEATSNVIDHVVSPMTIVIRGHEDRDDVWSNVRSVVAESDGVRAGDSRAVRRAAHKNRKRAATAEPGSTTSEEGPAVPDPLTVLPEEEGGGEPPSANVHDPEASTGSEKTGFRTGADVSAAGHHASVMVEVGPGGVKADPRLDGKEVLVEPGGIPG